MDEILLRYAELVICGLVTVVCFFIQRLIVRIDLAIKAVDIIAERLKFIEDIHKVLQQDQTSLWKAHDENTNKIQRVQTQIAVLEKEVFR